MTVADPGDMNKALKKRQFSRPGESVILFGLTLCAAVSLVTTVLIVVVLVRETATFFQHVSFADFFLETEWQPLFTPVSFGIWELVAGTVNVVFWALVMALPLGIATAIYLSEYAAPRTRRILKPMLESLAGVPTVVYAYFAVNVITLEVLRPIFGKLINSSQWMLLSCLRPWSIPTGTCVDNPA